MTVGSDVSFFCPVDGTDVSPAPNGSIMPTFAVTMGSAVVPTSATVVGAVFPGDQIQFSTQMFTYTVAFVDDSGITLTTPYTGTTDPAATATTAGSSDLTNIFANQPFVRRITAITHGTLVVNMLGVRGRATLITLFVNDGGFYDGCFTYIDASSTATGIAVFQ